MELSPQDDDAPHLTCRELQVLKRVAHGRSAKEVARELGIARRTVERHIENARYKMRARNKTHMIAKAVRCGELTLDDDPLNGGAQRSTSGFMINN
jgi:LuxR family transcriptional regulator, transcriptional regulator of spore coat protein